MRNRIISLAIIALILDIGSLMAKEGPTNRLINEKSPYLLQHANNPVNWFPWGEEAFRKAKREDKPIFLSIGYSTCHWCHVMEEESFSNPTIANILNENFVSIKVDREERPDVDNVYMNAVVSMTGSGGWPLTVFLTHDLKPFYGGTYFPPGDRWGKPGLERLLILIAGSWKNERTRILDSAESLTDFIKQKTVLGSSDASELDEEVLNKAYNHLIKSYDEKYAGFGGAPKFPSTHTLSFLLRYYKRSGKKEALKMAEDTLMAMAGGGIYDHLGGGFHRYATDERWRIPHFEKMLYDQALISRTYLEAYQLTGKEDYAVVAGKILDFVLNRMRHPKGGFYSAMDADSKAPDDPNVKGEGLYYLWRKSEIDRALGKDESEIFCYRFGVEERGNIPHNPHEEFSKKNVLYAANSYEDTASRFNLTVGSVKKIIDESSGKLNKKRLTRPEPFLDDKILVDWNGLMISALSLGAIVLKDRRYKTAAEDSARFIMDNLKDGNGRLLHRFRDGDAGIGGMLDDYAFFIQGLFDLYEASFNIRYLEKAKDLTNEMLRFFWDEEGKGFFLTAYSGERLFVRPKELYDGSVPSGNSVAMLDLIRLCRLSMDTGLGEKADATFRSFSNEISGTPQAYSQMLIALDFSLGPSKEIVISEGKDTAKTAKFLEEIHNGFLPNKFVVFRPMGTKEYEKVKRVVPFIENQPPINDHTTVYICSGYVCGCPTTVTGDIQKLLAK